MNQVDGTQMSAKYILLVEDNLDEIFLTERAFAICQISDNLLVMQNGQDLLDYLYGQENHDDKILKKMPSVILLDLNLPKISGLDVLRRIRADDDTCMIPVIILTSSTDDYDISESYRLGVDEYIRKPTSFSEFIQVVRRIKSKWIDH